jgi:hypothetical protein
MNQPALATSAPAPFLRRAFDWWIAQVKHALPPTIFFFVGFNLILWTKRLILEEHGVEFGGFDCDVSGLAGWKSGPGNRQSAFYASLRRCAADPAHLVQECDLLAMCIHGAASRGARPFSRRGRRDSRFPRPPSRALLLAALLVGTALVDGFVSCVRHDTRAQYAHRRRRTLSPILPMELVRGKLTRRQRIRLLTRLNRPIEANPIEAFSERGSPAHTELVAILRELALRPSYRRRINGRPSSLPTN